MLGEVEQAFTSLAGPRSEVMGLSLGVLEEGAEFAGGDSLVAAEPEENPLVAKQVPISMLV